MSGLGYQKIRYESNLYGYAYVVHEGTAARTRPLSYDEIMLQRKRKKQSEDVKEEAREVGKVSLKSKVEVVSGYLLGDRNEKYDEDSNLGERKIVSSDLRMSISRKKEENARKEENPGKARKGHDRDVETKSKHMPEKDGVRRTETSGRDYGHDRDVETKSKHMPEKEGLRRTQTSGRDYGHDRDVETKSKHMPEKDGIHRTETSGRDYGHDRDVETKLKRLPEKDGIRRTETGGRDHGYDRDVETKLKHMPEKDGFRRTETSGRDHGHDRDVETKLKHMPEKDGARRTETSGRDHALSKVDVRSRFHSDHDYESKYFDDRKHENRYMESSRETSNGGPKRKGRIEDVDRYKGRHDVKLHTGRGHLSEYAERKTRVETSYPQHEEAMLKRRRSRSPEHFKERYRSRGSPSPKDHEYVSSRRHDHDEVSFRSHKEKHGRHHSDVDKSRLSNNGSRSHYNKHGDSSSGLGGYSPRKRKTEAAVKTPSPPKRSPEKKSSPRKLPPSGTDRSLAASTVSGEQLTLQTKTPDMVDPGLVVPVTVNVMQPFFALASNKLSLVKGASIDSIQLTQATRPMRRLYVENVPSSASEKDIMECLNNFLLSSGVNHIQGTKPCISCMIHKEKGQALVEFLTPEDASAALAFDGRNFSGYVLKIRRPKDFVDVTTGSSEKLMAEADTSISHSISDVVKDSPHKIFIGGISEALSSEMLMEIASVFGPLKSYRFEANKLVDGPCAFLEYADQSVTPKAYAGLNGLKIGGRILTVAQAVPNAMNMDDSGRPPSYEIPEHVKSLLEKPTPVLKIKNVLDPEAMSSLSEADLEEIVEDVRLECARFGSVKSVNVIKSIPAAPELDEVMDDEQSSQTQQDLILESREGDDHGAGVGNTMNHLDIFEEGSVENKMVESNPNPVDRLESSQTDPTSGAVAGLPEHGEDQSSFDKVMQSDGDHTDGDKCNIDIRESNTRDSSFTGIQSRSGETVQGALNRENSERDPVESNERPVNDRSIESTVRIYTNNQDASEHEEVKERVQEDVKSQDGEGIEDAEDVLDFGGMFEVGCVFVEFRRSEASCLAAHSLHGRAFDDRIVTVEYIPHSIYKSKFPK